MCLRFWWTTGFRRKSIDNYPVQGLRKEAYLARHCCAVRPGRYFAIVAHWEPYLTCNPPRASSSLGFHASLLMAGSKCLLHLPCKTWDLNLELLLLNNYKILASNISEQQPSRPSDQDQQSQDFVCINEMLYNWRLISVQNLAHETNNTCCLNKLCMFTCIFTNCLPLLSLC